MRLVECNLFSKKTHACVFLEVCYTTGGNVYFNYRKSKLMVPCSPHQPHEWGIWGGPFLSNDYDEWI